MTMRAVKAVKQNYTPPPQLLNLLEQFRRMVNDCVGLGLSNNLTSVKSLSTKAYHQLSVYDVPTQYRLTAISKAVGILRNYRQALRKGLRPKKPHADRLMLTDCYAFKIVDSKLRLTIRARKEYVFIPLNAHTLRCIESYTVRSVCLTARNMSIAFSKETAQIEPTGLIALDCNLDNITTASTDKTIHRHELSRATEVKEACRQTKRAFTRNDHRVIKELYAKYGAIQRNRVGYLLHCVSKRVVQEAKTKQFGIVMENIKGIRRRYRKGNGQGRDYRARMDSWSFAELQRQIQYKAQWEGIPIYFVNPRKTSSTCAVCGFRIVEYAGRMVCCPHCKNVADRNENAAMNVLNAGLRFSLKGFAGEAMGAEPSERLNRGNPPSRCEPVTSQQPKSNSESELSEQPQR